MRSFVQSKIFLFLLPPTFFRKHLAFTCQWSGRPRLHAYESKTLGNCTATKRIKLTDNANCVSLPRKHFIPLSLSTCLNSFLTIFRPDPCVLPIQISLPDQPVLLATFPLGRFLCLHLLLGTLYLNTFVLSTPYPPLNAA